MNFGFIHNFIEWFENDEFAVIYSGSFNDTTLLSLTDLIAIHYEKCYPKSKLKAKFVYLTIEAFQNAIKYASSLNKENIPERFFMTRKRNDDFIISTANAVEKSTVEKLKNKIDSLNKMNKNELKKRYKEVLLNQQFSHKGGAGLGFIEMTRKTNQNLNYAFRPIDQYLSLYFLIINFQSNEKNNVDISKNLFDIYDIISQNKIILFIKHDFDEHINGAIFRTVEDNLKIQNTYRRKLIYQLMVESLQNISRYSNDDKNKKTGVFYLLRNNQDDFIIITGNFVHYLDIDFLNDFLKILKNSDKKTLDELYRKSLRNDDFDGHGGIGLIDIARSAKFFDYKFYKINENYSFFVLIFKV
jgi:hypothetical protein